METSWTVCSENTQQMLTFEHCVTMRLMKRGSHPERVVLLGQVGEDVGVEHSGLQEVAPQRSQLGAELAHIPADLLCYLLMAILQLMETKRGQKNHILVISN